MKNKVTYLQPRIEIEYFYEDDVVMRSIVDTTKDIWGGIEKNDELY